MKLKKLIISLLATGSVLLSSCALGRQKQELVWSKWYDNGDGTHSRHSLNDISIQESDEHHFVLTNTLEQPTEVAPGRAIYTCEQCSCKEERVVPPTGNYVFDQKVVDEKYLLERYSEHSASYYMSSKEGAFGDPRYVFEVSDIPSGYTEVDYVESDGRQWIDTGVKNDSYHEVNINNSSKNSRIPEDFQELEYIESSGVQYVDTGIQVSSSISYELTYQYKELTNDECDIFGCDVTPFDFVGTCSGKFRYIAQDGTILYQDVDTNKHHLVKRYNQVKVDDNVLYTSDSITSYSLQYNYYLFAASECGEKSIDYFCEAKLFECKIWNNNELVREFVPAKRTRDNVVGLFDVVENKFYQNNGSGLFAAGPEVHYKQNASIYPGYTELQFIESTGTQYIKTGIYGCAKWTITIQFTQFGTRMLMGYNGSGGNYWGVAEQSDYRGTEEGDYETYTAWSGHLKAGNKDVIVDDFGDSTEGIETRYLNGVLAQGPREIATDVSDVDYELLALDNGQALCYAKLYSVKAEKNGVVVANFVPAIEEASGKAGLFDMISKKFLGNSGTGEFVKGSAVEYNSSLLPEDYVQLEYLESTGTQQINLNTPFDLENGSIEIDFQASVLEQNGMIIGNFFGDYHIRYLWLYHYYVNQEITIFLNGDTQTQQHLGTSPIDVERHNAIYRNKTFFIDNVEKGSATGTLGESDNLYLFSSGNDYHYTGKIFSFKLDNGNGLVRNMVPCYRISDGITGMYDLVSNQLFINSGSGTFLRGPEINKVDTLLPADYQQVEYVRSDGNQWIDAQVIFNNGDTAGQVVDIQFLDESRHWCGANWYLQYCFDPRYVNTHDRVTFSQQYANKSLKSYVNGNMVSDEDFSTRDIPADIFTGVFRLGDSDGTWYSNSSDTSDEPSSQILYSLKIYKNGILMRDFLPCYKISNDEVGLYDLVSHSFFANEGTTPLQKGPNANVADGSRDYNSLEKAGIPEYFYQLNYIESTGLQTLDTGVVGAAKIDTTIKFIKNSSAQIMGYSDTDGHYFGVGPDNKYIGTTIEAGNIDHVVVDLSNTTLNKSSIKINEEEPVNFDIPDLEDKTMKLFSTGGDSNKCLSLLYSAKVYQGETLVRDFVPVMQKQTGAVGLYDLVNNRFYESTTSYKFEAGGIMYGGIDTADINVFCNLASNKSHPYSTKISSYKVYEENEIVRDYVPVIRNSDGVAGLYDLKNNQFYTSNSEFPLKYGKIIGHKLDEGTVTRKATYNVEGEIVYKCIYTNEEIHLSTECTAYKVTFVSNNANLTAVKIFNEVDPNNFEMSMIGYTRNSNTYNYSKSGAYIFFEIPDDGNEYTVETTSGKVNNVKGQPRQFKITDIKGDVFIQLKVK